MAVSWRAYGTTMAAVTAGALLMLGAASAVGAPVLKPGTYTAQAKAAKVVVTVTAGKGDRRLVRVAFTPSSCAPPGARVSMPRAVPLAKGGTFAYRGAVRGAGGTVRVTGRAATATAVRVTASYTQQGCVWRLNATVARRHAPARPPTRTPGVGGTRLPACKRPQVPAWKDLGGRLHPTWDRPAAARGVCWPAVRSYVGRWKAAQEKKGADGGDGFTWVSNSWSGFWSVQAAGVRYDLAEASVGARRADASYTGTGTGSATHSATSTGTRKDGTGETCESSGSGVLSAGGPLTVSVQGTRASYTLTGMVHGQIPVTTRCFDSGAGTRTEGVDRLSPPSELTQGPGQVESGSLASLAVLHGSRVFPPGDPRPGETTKNSAEWSLMGD